MNAISPNLACCAGGMAFGEARARVLALAPGLPMAPETVPLEEGAGRIAAAPVRARLSLPGFDQSAMDGYAVRTAGLLPGAWLPVAGRTAAGEEPVFLRPGTAHRILTGAPVPEGADAVIAQEEVLRREDTVRIGAPPAPGAHLRRRGEDIAAGDTLLREGTLLDWRHLAVLAAQGIGSVEVRRRPRVALLSSGRELRAPGDELATGQIHDSNGPMLRALLRAWGAEVHIRPPVADEPAAMREALRDAAAGADLVLTTAGISVGEEDHVRDALLSLGGELSVLKVAMKPGKPLGAGRIGDAVFLGLPGNPQAALAGALAFLRPLLARMTGAAEPAGLAALAGFAMARKPGRAEFIPVSLHRRGACLRAERAGPDGAGRLAPLLLAQGLAFLPAGRDEIRPGDELEILPFPSAFPGEAAHG
ncbi:molybdopterin molybdotransferase MoeA [Muricoccus pecuniae]|uniref:Molybdopterin molybdenumtransferase n=1 Tax=Muricoccus pecuniae TaxID=693023 RepID=A0A840Y563_9PROT|nr:gephyrin-like molybdotransferase Glp [Roseomonas pecuniae]MBB5695286.1 molybdopterin molybdotransferase [Roseomonas pecuniae]